MTYTDVFDTVTAPTYEVGTGRVTQISTTPASGAVSVTAYTYDLDGKAKTVTVDGQQLAAVTCDALARRMARSLIDPELIWVSGDWSDNLCATVLLAVSLLSSESGNEKN